MYDVLIGIDNAEDSRAIAQAEAIVDLPTVDGAVTAHLCHVFQENPEGASVHQISAVRRARETLEEAGINCVHYEASGDPTDELLAAADDIDADAICVSGRKRRPTGKAVFGSVTQDVILGADRPIFAVPAPRSD
ncbi:universal stress protein [Halorubrum lacusprofundi]|jgi:nucleotide-binding universal stress UspA family protein|uniref:UspA domain protein n=1 Tax=Halorubrum lacusprofundi (strain ATCC 49239 / DSM 5036 / JCM 8891 / ACAM 34) TaxID=416348 RepID=B9LP69_HALLT|nr:universal stress protein [Halorubrum lacusprofundi]ACM57157.1 UspA domain protein [Halorubrum lacusprofundi ATCC 49239]MCG1007318.1 universal stress protein [Halorubrum lacusprofundi]